VSDGSVDDVSCTALPCLLDCLPVRILDSRNAGKTYMRMSGLSVGEIFRRSEMTWL
jgi:hypothetical protein